MNREEITPAHRARLACVYVRQSSTHQVVHHQESLRRQRDLVDRAFDLGWPRDQIVVFDQDLGETASRSGERAGFDEMVAEAAVGKIGIIFGLDVSRISRGNRNWYHLLDICAIRQTLIADAEGLYDPRSYNDRLLLGLKGTMSEAELHMMKQRLVEAMRSKAQRGAFRFRAAPGYVWDEAGRMVKDPDDQVRSSIERIFARFEQLGSVCATHRSLFGEGIEVPVLSGPGHRKQWKLPDEGYVHRVLRNPLYAGAYAYGRSQVEEALDASQRPIKRVRRRDREHWPVLIRDHHESYVSWEQFERNQRQIAANRKGADPGAPREGRSLLQGLLLCGHCGRRMQVRYGRRGRHLRYVCIARRRQNQLAPARCPDLGGVRIEGEVERLVLAALEPLGVEAMIQATAAHVQASESARVRWEQQIERARYEVDLARRQYEAVDPANRLVAGELERRWEVALKALEEVRRQAGAQLQALERPLSEADQQRLRQYTRDLPGLWTAGTTRVQDKKRILRCLIENVVVTVPGEGPDVRIEVHWVGGDVTSVTVRKGRPGENRYVADEELVELVSNLAEEFTDDQIARILVRKGIKTPKGLSFTTLRVASMRGTHDIPGRGRRPLSGEDVYDADQAGEILGVDRSTVVRWVQVGLLKGTQRTQGAPWRIRVTAEDRRRLNEVDAPAGWLPLKGAAQALGVSQQTVLQRLKRGDLEGVRVRIRARASWRIRIPSTSYAPNVSLFE
jgi:DNA invertase Pin-like site-specific DNA recombinase